MVALYHVNLATLESFFPGFPSLCGSHFELATRQICARFGGWQRSRNYFYAIAGTVATHTHTHTCTLTLADLLAQLIGVALHLDLQLLLYPPVALSSPGSECVQLHVKGTASPVGHL